MFIVWHNNIIQQASSLIESRASIITMNSHSALSTVAVAVANKQLRWIIIPLTSYAVEK